MIYISMRTKRGCLTQAHFPNPIDPVESLPYLIHQYLLSVEPFSNSDSCERRSLELVDSLTLGALEKVLNDELVVVTTPV